MSTRGQFIPLSSIASASQLEQVTKFQIHEFCISSELRGKTIDWLCLSERLLWMALGQDFIEPELLDWIDEIPADSVIFDVGASNGIFAMYAAACGHAVTAFEPDPSNFFLLSYNNYLNSRRATFKPAECLNLAVSDGRGVADLHIASWELGGHEKILDNPVSVAGEKFHSECKQRVITTSVDEFISDYAVPSPQYIKVDVDGAEKKVVLGACSTLRSARSLFIELKEEEADSFFIPYLSDLGLHVEYSWQVQRYVGLRNYVFSRS